MCLEPGFKKPTESELTGVGYKVFRDWIGALCGALWGLHDNRPTYRWLKEANYREGLCCSPKEGFGWHISPTKEDAFRWGRAGWSTGGFVVKRVKYRGATAIGESQFWDDTPFPTIVAKEIYIYKGEIVLGRKRQ